MIQGYCISALGQNFFLRIFNRQNQLWCIGAYMYHDFSTHISRSSSSKKLSNNRIMNGQIHMYFHFFQGSFNNYVDKKRGEGVSRKTTLGHVTKVRYHVKCPLFSTRGERGSRLGKIWSTQLLNVPSHIFKPLEFDLRQSKDSRNFQFECWLAGRH